MRYLLELTEGDSLDTFPTAVAREISLEAAKQWGDENLSSVMHTNFSDSDIILLGKIYVSKMIQQDGRFFVPLQDEGVTLGPSDEGENKDDDNLAESVTHVLIPSSKGTQKYDVVIDENGIALSCTCPAFTYRPQEVCKHMRDAEERWSANHAEE